MTGFDPASLAVVIPTRDRWDVLGRTLTGLRRQSVTGFSVVVVVDGRDQCIPALPAGVVVVEKDHAGPGAARNAGVHATDAPLVLLLGDDMIPAPDLVEEHLNEHSRQPAAEVGVLGRVEWHPDVRRGRLQRWLEWSGTQFDFDGISGVEAGPGRFYSSNVSVKRDFFLDVGGFDEDFPFVYEDIDLGLRLAQKGLRLRYLPSARTLHLHRYRWPTLQGRFRIVGSGEYIMTAKHPELSPYFLEKLQHRRRAASVSAWPWLVDMVPRTSTALRRMAEERATSWYWKKLTAPFLEGWTAGAELCQLRSYLDADFDYPRLVGRASGEPKCDGDELLYRQTAEVMGGRYSEVVDRITSLVPKGGTVLHVGAGTGTVGLHLLAEGHDVTFVAVRDRRTDYLRWRLGARGARARLLEVDALTDLSTAEPEGRRYDLALVLDLAPGEDPHAILTLLETRAEVVVAAGGQGKRLPVATRGTELRRWRHPQLGTVVAYATSARSHGRHQGRRWRWLEGRLPPRRIWPPLARS